MIQFININIDSFKFCIVVNYSLKVSNERRNPSKSYQILLCKKRLNLIDKDKLIKKLDVIIEL